MFKDRLRDARENNGLSQIVMAKKLGIATTTYRNYENTSREPNYDILVHIANILGVSTDYLLENENKDAFLNTMLVKASNLSERSLKELDSYIDFLYYKEKKKPS